MKKFRSLASAQENPPSPISTIALAHLVKVSKPVRLSAVIDALRQPVTFHANITTPSGTALGGTVDITLFSDGKFSFNVHMHDSGWDPYDFRVRCAVKAPSGLTILFQTSGHTDGTGSNPLGHVQRDFDHNENGTNPLIQQFWLDVRASSLSVSKSYSDAGVLNTLEELAKDLLGFLVADVAFGAELALVIVAGAELSKAFNVSVGQGGLVGVLVAGGVVWMLGPAAIMPAVVAGVAAGAITDAMIKHRTMTDEEYRFANTVFDGTLPPKDRIFLTNLSHGGGRKYTWPSLDGSVIVNLNTAFDDPMHSFDSDYPTKGQSFIHELTHAWQIQTKSFLPGIICKRVFGTSSYDFGPAGQAWSEFGLEQQAAIVDAWFGKYAGMWNTIEDVVKNLATQDAVRDPYFGYISNNIRLGQN
jgi:hypothetical protein